MYEEEEEEEEEEDKTPKKNTELHPKYAPPCGFHVAYPSFPIVSDKSEKPNAVYAYPHPSFCLFSYPMSNMDSIRKIICVIHPSIYPCTRTL
jgi:hypothetical protein